MTVAERRQQEREDRRNLILSAAEEVFHAKGVDAATMEDVAAEARLGKGTLYLYFRSKDDLLMGMASRRHDQMIALFGSTHQSASDGLSELRGLLLSYATNVSTPLEHLQMVLSCWIKGRVVREGSPEAAELRRQVGRAFDVIVAAVERGQRDGTIREGLDARRAALNLWASVNGALLLKLQLAFGPGDNPIRDIAPTLPESIEACLDAVRVHDAPSVPASSTVTPASTGARGAGADDEERVTSAAGAAR